MKEPKIMVVKWADAWSIGGYYKETNDHTPLLVTDIGFVCEENDDCIVLCMSVDENDSRRHLVIIPWEYIISMEELV